MSFSNDKPPESTVTVYPNIDRRRVCEEKTCKRSADLHVKLGSPPSGKGHYWCAAEHWIQARSVLITRNVRIRYAEGATDRIIERLRPAAQQQQSGCGELLSHKQS